MGFGAVTVGAPMVFGGPMLSGHRVMIVEDEPITGLGLADEVVSFGGSVVGPFRKVSDAMASLKNETVDGAILDVNLIDGNVAPVAAELAERDVAFVFYSAQPPAPLRDAYPRSKALRKPQRSNKVVATLADAIKQTRPS
jgi:two-component SAPR family response regulator